MNEPAPKPNSAGDQFEHGAPIIKTSAPERFTLCPILVPDVADLQGDVINRNEIRKALWGVEDKADLFDQEHFLVDHTVGRLVEKYVLPQATFFPLVKNLPPEAVDIMNQIATLQKSLEAMKTSEGAPVGVLIPDGSAMVGTIWEAGPWASIQKGELSGLSIYGVGNRTKLP